MTVHGSDVGTAAGFGGKPPAREMRVSFRAFENDAKSMPGFLDIELPSGLMIHDAKLMVGPAGRRWLSLPSVRETNPDGSFRLVDGKPAWKQIVEIRDKAIRQKFEDQVFAALRRQAPGLFRDDEA
jgi:hypothetical protein